jgi:PAS domain S-box-containing protein
MLRSPNIRQKLALVLWGAASVALIIAVVALFLVEKLTLKRRASQMLQPYAQLVSVGATAAIAFEDPGRAEEILNTLRSNPQILEAQLVLADGALLAGYRSKADAAARIFSIRSDGVYLERDTAEMVQNLPGGAHLHLVMSLDQLRRLSSLSVWIFGAGSTVLLFATLGLLVALQRIIVRPISVLAEAAEQVRARGDYARRVPAAGGDEIAILGRSFNAMMHAVQERENDLRQLGVFQRTILSNVAYGIISATPDGVVTSFNPAAERLLGYPAEEVVGKQTPALWHDPDEMARRARQLSEELGETVAPGFAVFVARACRGLPEENEWTLIRKDRTRVPALLSVTALRDERGQITGYVGLTSDLTERRRAEEALRKLNEELEQRVQARTTDLQAKGDELRENQRALVNLVEDMNEKTVALEAANIKLEAVNKELEAFSYSVSHDLRAPLRSLDGFSQALIEDYGGKLDAPAQHYLQRIRSGSQRMARLIDDLLNLSRLSRGELGRETVNLSSLAQDIVGELARREPDRKVALALAPHAMVTGDPRLLRVMLENLLGNAWKFTAKQPDAKLEFGQTQQDGQPAYFVRDNGAGFDMNYASRLFGAFQRLHSTEEFPGTGIGLATVQRIIHRHGGRVWAESQVGAGATFYFRLQ